MDIPTLRQQCNSALDMALVLQLTDQDHSNYFVTIQQIHSVRQQLFELENELEDVMPNKFGVRPCITKS